MLIIVEDGDLHALAQFALDEEALRCLDVFQVDAAEGRLQRGDDIDQLLRVFFVDLDVKHIDTGKLLEQAGLAFHDGLRGFRADVAQAEHGGAVGHHADEVAAGGVAERVGDVFDDLFARRGHTRGVRQGQIALVRQRLGRRNGNLARGRKLVILQRGLAQGGALLRLEFFIRAGGLLRLGIHRGHGVSLVMGGQRARRPSHLAGHRETT